MDNELHRVDRPTDDFIHHSFTLIMSSSTSNQAIKYVGLATAALAGLALIKTIAGLDTADRRKKSAAGCCSNDSSSSYVTVGSDPTSNPYETQQSVYEYLLMHFGETRELVNFPDIQSAQLKSSINFPRECAELCGKYAARVALPAGTPLAALDIGCSVGRSSFEMTRFAGEVLALDYSQAFIDAANQLKQGGELPYTMRTEGDLTQSSVARVASDIDRSRVAFIQGDACDLSASIPFAQQFHVVLAANLLCRLPYPRRFLDAIPSLIAAGGYLVMPSPYTWLEQYTPKSEWIGGYYDAKTGEAVKSFDNLKKILEGSGLFKLEEAFDMPFFIRETARKNQWSVSHVTVWKRTDKPAVL